MKLTTSQADLSAALATVRSAVQSGRPSHPILATVLLTATPGTLSLAGFDLKTSISTTIAASIDFINTIDFALELYSGQA
ncbi:MAG: hypothetical protein ACO387_04035 [Flavobacteriaceae bacterium]